MPLFTKSDAAASFPIDTTTPFHPAQAVYVKEGTGADFALSLAMTDITAAVVDLLLLLPSRDIQPDQLFKAAKSTTTPTTTPASPASPASPSPQPPPPLLQVKRPNRLSRTWTATEPTNSTPAAELTNPLWSLGKWTIKFPPQSPHSTHDIYLRPAGFAARADEFVKDSVPYFWDVENTGATDARRLCKLYRAGGDGKKVEIARFVGERGSGIGVRMRDGVLLLVGGSGDAEREGEGRGDGRLGLDVVVVLLTLVAVLNRSDSFRA